MSDEQDKPITKERRDELVKTARDIAQKAIDEKRELTDDEAGQIDKTLAEVKGMNEHMLKSKAHDARMALLNSMVPDDRNGADEQGDPQGQKALSIGEHFVKHAHGKLVEGKGTDGLSIAAPDWSPAGGLSGGMFGMKAATDPQILPAGLASTPYFTDFDRTIVQALRVRLTVADLLGQGTVSGNAISYLVEGAMEGDFATVAEGAVKPQIHFVDPTQVTDALKKLAGWIRMTDEFIEDADFLVSEINNRLLYQLGYREEQQLLNGNGTGTNLLGILNRSGIQTEVSASAATTPADWADAIFRAATKVETNSGLPTDGVIIHPTDYQTFRLRRDGNGQYYGGGFFEGQYGNGGMPEKPPLWGYRTVVTPAIAQGTVAVGAFRSSGTVYRKGGVRVQSTNSHASDFTSNIVTIRAEERIALALRQPLGICKVTLTP